MLTIGSGSGRCATCQFAENLGFSGLTSRGEVGAVRNRVTYARDAFEGNKKGNRVFPRRVNANFEIFRGFVAYFEGQERLWEVHKRHKFGSVKVGAELSPRATLLFRVARF